jgi:hypothetical protein
MPSFGLVVKKSEFPQLLILQQGLAGIAGSKKITVVIHRIEMQLSLQQKESQYRNIKI